MPIAPFPFITVSGVPEERGRQYGVLAGERIRRSAGLYSGTLDTFGLSPARRQSLIEEFAGRIEEFDASYVEEMRGIAKGADVPFEHIVMINARTEVVAMARAETGSADPEEQDDGCTGALIMPAKSASGNLVHGQNWDWRSECAETGIVLRVRNNCGPDFVTFVEAGGLARSGFNEAGISITANYGMRTRLQETGRSARSCASQSVGAGAFCQSHQGCGLNAKILLKQYHDCDQCRLRYRF